MEAERPTENGPGSTPRVCHVHLDLEPASGPWNMAVDDVLLHAAVESGCCSLRFYRWSEPTVSLGYFQASDALLSAPLLSTVPAVRRLSGGGAILHHHEITYSCAVPAHHPLVRVPSGLYRAVHESVIQVLSRLGIPLRMRGEPVHNELEPFLCFGRGDPHDVLLRGQKVLGSAQRRRRGSVLQHGSLLLKRSPLAPEHPGLLDLLPEATISPQIAEDLAETIGALLGPRLIYGPLSEAEQRSAAELESGKYQRLDWPRQSRVSAGSD